MALLFACIYRFFINYIFRPPVILGVTNPFFAKTLQHWPHIIRIGEMSGEGNIWDILYIYIYMSPLRHKGLRFVMRICKSGFMTPFSSMPSHPFCIEITKQKNFHPHTCSLLLVYTACQLLLFMKWWNVKVMSTNG